MKVLVSVSYVVDTEKNEFWDKETGELKMEVQNAIEKQFPNKIGLANEIQGRRVRLSHMPLGLHSEKCPQCGSWMTSKPELFSALPLVKEINGAKYCESCAYDVRNDI